MLCLLAFELLVTPSALDLNPVEFDVVINNEVVGQVAVSDRTNAEGEGGLFADFTATGRTLEQLYTHLKLGSQGHLNWFQIITDTNIPNQDIQGNPLTVPYIDPPKGGTLNLWADDVPWYLNESVKPSADTRVEIPELQLEYQSFGSILGYEDFPFGPPGRTISFETFLVADFGDQTYDTLGGFSWTAEVGGNGLTDIISLEAGAVFTSDYAQQIENEFGWSKVLKLPTYSFSDSLSPGQVDSFSQSGLEANAPFLTWTDNLPDVNPPNTPDTVLGTFDPFGQLINYNDDGGLLGANYASGLMGFATGSVGDN